MKVNSYELRSPQLSLHYSHDPRTEEQRGLEDTQVLAALHSLLLEDSAILLVTLKVSGSSCLVAHCKIQSVRHRSNRDKMLPCYCQKLMLVLHCYHSAKAAIETECLV